MFILPNQPTKLALIVVNVEASTPEKLPDVEQEDGSDSGFNADVDQWGKEENTEFPL